MCSYRQWCGSSDSFANLEFRILPVLTNSRIFIMISFSTGNGILLPKLFLPTVRKTFEIRGCRPTICKNEITKEQFIQTVKGQSNLW